MDVTRRTSNALLLIKVQTAEGVPATPDPTLDAVPFEKDSINKSTPFTNEQSNEVSGSMVASTPLVIAQAATVSFRSRIKGAGNGTTYTSTVKPPLHQALLGCGWRGLFTAAIATALLTAGGAASATLGTGFGTTAQMFLGMPLIFTAGVGNGDHPFIVDYTAAKVASLSQTFSPVLDTTTSASLPANWTYAGTSPADDATRATDQPFVTIWYYEDGILEKWQDCRGVLDLEGQNARPGYGTFNFTGTWISRTDVSMPTNAVVAMHGAPILMQQSGLPPAFVVNRRKLAISRWALRSGGNVESPDDPNSVGGFGSGQILERAPMVEFDPLRTALATRDALAELAAFTQYSAAMRFGLTAGNRWGLVMPKIQLVDAGDGVRNNSLRADQISAQVLSGGRDANTRDSDRFLVFY